MDAVTRMAEEPVGRLLVRFSVPAIAGFLANACYQLVDRIIVGRGVGTDGIAAVTAAFPLSLLALALGMLVGAGACTQMSVLLGRADRDGAERMLGQALRLSFMNGGALAIVTWLFTEPILLACGAAPRLLPMAVPFARTIAVGQLFLIALLSMGNILRVQGRPNLSTLIMISSNVLNAVLAATAVFVLHLGVQGVALATALSQAAGLCAVMAFVQDKSSVIRMRLGYLCFDRERAGKILRLGAPFGATHILGALVMLAANHGANCEGMRGMAALGVLNTVGLMLVYPPLGVMVAMQPLVGYNLGRGLTSRVRSLLLHALLMTIAMGVAFYVCALATQGPVARLFTKDDIALIALVRPGLPWFVLPVVLFGVTGTMSHYLLATHQPRKSSVLLLGRQLLAIPLFLLMPRWFGFHGIYLVTLLADIPFVVCGAKFLMNELSELHRPQEAVEPA
ncbi:MAG: MATE family efflux transporter [Polyangiaceae bacterium]|nr:MATE family efflux transporter [Polyangiaceae bacterium]